MPWSSLAFNAFAALPHSHTPPAIIAASNANSAASGNASTDDVSQKSGMARMVPAVPGIFGVKPKPKPQARQCPMSPKTKLLFAEVVLITPAG